MGNISLYLGGHVERVSREEITDNVREKGIITEVSS